MSFDALERELEIMMSQTSDDKRDFIIKRFMRVLACSQEMCFEEKMRLRSAAKNWFTHKYGELPYFNYFRRAFDG